MKGDQLWEQYQHYTRDVTDHGRKLGFAGAAICWMFKNEKFSFPTAVYVALFCFVAYFVADLLQSLTGALTIRFFTEHQEKKQWQATHSIGGEIHKPRWVDAPAFIFFILKCLLLGTGFIFIGCELFIRLMSY